MAEQAGGAKERIERSGAADQGQRPVGGVRLFFDVFVDHAAAIGRDAVGTFHQRLEAADEMVETALGKAVGKLLLHRDDTFRPLVAQGPDPFEEELLQVDGEHEPAGARQVGREPLDLAADLELGFRRVLDDGETVVAHRADARPFGRDQVSPEGLESPFDVVAHGSPPAAAELGGSPRVFSAQARRSE